MKHSSLFGWGICIYAFTYLVWSGFVIYDFVDGAAPRVAAFIVLSIVAAVAGSSLHLASWKDILPYSLAWAVCVAILNTVMSAPFVGWGVFSAPYVWIGYAFVVIVPLLCAKRVSITDEIFKWRT